MLILLLALGFGVYWVIKHRRFSEALLAVAVVGAVVSFIGGIILVCDNNENGWLVGSIMQVAGLGVVTSIGLVLRKQDPTN